MLSGVYIIWNIVNNKVYIGRSTNVRKRLETHKSKLRRGTYNDSTMLEEFREYGEENFKFGVIEFCSDEKLCEREHYWITETDCTNPDNGYNHICSSQGGRKLSVKEDLEYINPLLIIDKQKRNT